MEARLRQRREQADHGRDHPERWMKSNCCLKMSPVSLSNPTMNHP